MTCEEIKEMTVPYLELDLEASRVRDITAHLEACGHCRSEMETVRQVLVRLKGRTVPDPGERFWSDFAGKVREEYRIASEQRKSWEAPAEDVAQRVSRRLSERVRQRLSERVRRQLTERVQWKGNRAWALALAASVVLLLGSWVLIARQQPPAPAGLTSQAPVKTPIDGSGARTDASQRKLFAGAGGNELPDLSEIDWEGTWDDDDPDVMLVELAARLDPPTLDRLFNDI